MKSVEPLLFLLLAAFWGGSFVAIKFVVADFPPIFGAMLRVAIAAAALGGLFTAQRRPLAVPFDLRKKMWLAGLLSIGVPFSLLFYGERMISPGLAGIINGTVPIWALLLGREKLTRSKSLGLALGLFGLGVIFAPILAFGGTRGEIIGTCSVVLMAVCYGAGSLLNKSLLSGAKADFRANIIHQHSAAVVFLIAASLALETWPAAGKVFSSPAALGATAYMGICSTAIAFMIYFHLIREWGVVRASAVTYVAPVFALFWDYVFFGSVPPPSQLAGVAAILAGVVLLNKSHG
jgi:drug/metabolite transporter (DMT)-like permease